MAEGHDYDVYNPEFDRDDVDDGDDDPLIDPADETTWEASSEMPSWADSAVPAGIPQEDLASTQQTAALVDRWQREWGELKANLEFRSSTKGDLWLRWGNEWLLLTNKKRPGEFLSPSTLKKYGASVTEALGIREKARFSRKEVAVLQTTNKKLEEAEANVENVELQDLGQTATEVIDVVETAFNGSTLDFDMGDNERMPLREIRGLNKAL